jgi:lysyl-tRNA synthetase, class I
VALGVDYEMAGKDLIDSVVQSSKIARVLGGRPPEGFNYEMFLDEKGEKISKSKGNGLSLEEWLSYGSEESLAFYIYREPKKAKSLHIGVIPRAVDDYWQFRGNYPKQPIEQKLGNPVHHIHAGKSCRGSRCRSPMAAAQPRQPARGRGQGDRVEVRPALCARHVAGKRSRARPADRAGGQLRARFRRSDLKRRADRDEAALRELDSELAKLPEDAGRRGIQHIVFEVGKTHYGKEKLRLVPGALRDPARLEPGPAHGQLHRALRNRQQPPPYRRGAAGPWRSESASASLRSIPLSTKASTSAAPAGTATCGAIPL